jgi:hypothetical protein
VLRASDGTFSRIPAEVFAQMNPDLLLVLTAPPNVIVAQIMERDGSKAQPWQLSESAMREMQEAELEHARDVDEQEVKHAGSLRLAAKEGDLENGSFMAGQVAGMISERGTAAQVVTELVQGAEEALGWGVERLLSNNQQRTGW